MFVLMMEANMYKLQNESQRSCGIWRTVGYEPVVLETAQEGSEQRVG